MEELTATQPVAATPRTWKPVYTIVERNERKWWTRVGTPNPTTGQKTALRDEIAGQLPVALTERLIA